MMKAQNEKGIIQIADTKSFAFTEGGNLRFGNQANRWYEILSTPFMSSPEMGPAMHSSADKMHVFMLGKNLYQYLSGCRCSYLQNKNNGANFDFSNPVFSTPEGKEFEILIKSMIQLNSPKRISMDAALESLQAIESKIATREMLKELKDEPTFAEFIREKELFINTGNKEQLISLQATIKTKITEAQELKTLRQETNALLQTLHPLNETSHESFIREQELFINTANKEQLASLQANIRTKITETHELQTARKETGALLNNLQGLNEPAHESFIREQELFINTANKEQLASLQANIKTKITETHELQTARKETRALLQNLKNLHAPSHEAFIQAQDNFISTASKEQLTTLKADLTHKISTTQELIASKAECRSLVQQFKTEARDKGSATKVATYFEQTITAAQSQAELKPVKIEVETKLAYEKALNILHREVPRLLAQIKTYGLGEKDCTMNQYIQDKMADLGNIKNKGDIDKLLDDLTKTLTSLQTPAQIQEIKVIRGIAKSIRDQDNYGSAKKADKIEQALYNVPLSQRGNIEAGTTPETFAVLKALAHHRHMHKKDVYLTKEGKIDKDEAPKSFVDYKKAMKAGREASSPAVKEQIELDNPDQTVESTKAAQL